MDQLKDFAYRLTSRSFLVTIIVVFVIARTPSLTVEQIVGLLVGAGLVTARAIGEDRVE